jgi:hypothetical protein
MKRAIGAWAVAISTVLSCASDPEQNAGPMTGGGSGTSGSMTGAAAAPAAGSGAGANCGALPPPANKDDLIANFEEGTGATIQTPTRGGGFYMFNDMTGMQTPPPGMLPPATSVSRCESTYALCMSGKNFTTWGAGMGTDFAPTSGGMGAGMKQTYDASAYTGVAFWAKSNTPSVAVRIGFKDKNTAPEGGVCDMAATSGAEACNDDWGKGLTFTSEWQPFTVKWSDLTQAGWGKAFTQFQVASVYSIQFQVSQGVDFDLCIDDLAFTR